MLVLLRTVQTVTHAPPDLTEPWLPSLYFLLCRQKLLPLMLSSLEHDRFRGLCCVLKSWISFLNKLCSLRNSRCFTSMPIVFMLSTVPSPRGDFGGLIPQNEAPSPQTETRNTNQWSFCHISECQAPYWRLPGDGSAKVLDPSEWTPICGHVRTCWLLLVLHCLSAANAPSSSVASLKIFGVQNVWFWANNTILFGIPPLKAQNDYMF